MPLELLPNGRVVGGGNTLDDNYTKDGLFKAGESDDAFSTAIRGLFGMDKVVPTQSRGLDARPIATTGLGIPGADLSTMPPLDPVTQLESLGMTEPGPGTPKPTLPNTEVPPSNLDNPDGPNVVDATSGTRQIDPLYEAMIAKQAATPVPTTPTTAQSQGFTTEGGMENLVNDVMGSPGADLISQLFGGLFNGNPVEASTGNTTSPIPDVTGSNQGNVLANPLLQQIFSTLTSPTPQQAPIDVAGIPTQPDVSIAPAPDNPIGENGTTGIDAVIQQLGLDQMSTAQVANAMKDMPDEIKAQIVARLEEMQQSLNSLVGAGES